MTSQAKSQTILQDELNGFYTIGRNINDLATLPSEQQLTGVVLLPPSAREAPGQRVWSISYAYPRIRSYNILFPRPVGGHENAKGNLYHN